MCQTGNYLISIILCSLNGHNRIDNSINSVMSQTHKKIELIVVDDGSTPPLDNTLKKYNDPRINYIRLNKNTGCSAARNEGLKYATGNYIAFIDDDDYWHYDKIERQLPILINNQRIGLVCCGAIGYHPDGTKMDRIPVRQYISYEMELIRDRIITSSVLCKREAITKSRGFESSLRRYGDWDCWINISKSYHIYAMKDKLLCTMIREGSLQRVKDISILNKARWRVVEMHWPEITRLDIEKQCTAAHQYSIGIRYLWAGEFQKAKNLFTDSLRHHFYFTTFIAYICACIKFKGNKRSRRISRALQSFSRMLIK